MKKIISLFVRDFSCMPAEITREVTPGAEWVTRGEGVATLKWDGTAALWKDGKLWGRFDAKRGKTPPAGWVECGPPDAVTGHHPGWVVIGDEPQNRWHREAAVKGCDFDGDPLEDGATYEVIGAKVQGNPYNLTSHLLARHGNFLLLKAPRDFDSLRHYFAENVIEGIVWHHADGRMVKIKRRDFGLPWPSNKP